MDVLLEDTKLDQFNPWVKLRDSDIVPDDYQAVLISIRDTMTESYFAIGDIANELVVKSALKGLKATDQRVFDAVGRFCGKSGRTVRYYAETSAFFSDEVRRKYHALAFSHFVFAKSMGMSWREVLDYALSDPGSTAELLKFRFLHSQVGEVGGEVPSVFESLRNFTRSADGDKLGAHSQDIDPTGQPSYALHADLAKISQLSDCLVWFADVVSRLPMESENERMTIMVNCLTLKDNVGRVAGLLCYNPSAV